MHSQEYHDACDTRAVVLESGLGLEYYVFLLSWTCLGLVGIWTRTWSSDSPNVQVGLDRVQQYMLFYSLSKQNH